MKRNRYNWLVIIMVLMVILYCTGCKSVNPSYNVLFIAVDDLRPDLGCYGNNQIISPNIDELAANGMVFQHAYCQTAICMASRASLMSGQYSASNRMYNCLSVDELMPEVESLNELFQKNGYDVFGIGKIYHHQIDNEKQFGNNWIDSKKCGTSIYITEEANAQINEKGYGPAWEIGNNEELIYPDEYTADWVTHKLAQLKNPEKPFFLAVGFYKPHLPFNAPQKYWDLYNPAEISLREIPEYPENGSLYGYHNSPEIRHYTNIVKGNDEIHDETARILKHGYCACISYIDAQVGVILDALKENNLDKNTIVVLWGDHGWKFGDHGMWCKHTNFELDTHVPLIISAPGFIKGKTSSFAELVDIYPTLAELCNLELPPHLHGKSLKPVLENPEVTVKEAAFSVWASYNAPRTDPEKAILGYTVRTNQYRYMEWVHVKSGKLLDRELYDHFTDPLENKNVIGDSIYKNDIKMLGKKMTDFRNLNKD